MSAGGSSNWQDFYVDEATGKRIEFAGNREVRSFTWIAKHGGPDVSTLRRWRNSKRLMVYANEPTRCQLHWVFCAMTKNYSIDGGTHDDKTKRRRADRSATNLPGVQSVS